MKIRADLRAQRHAERFTGRLFLLLSLVLTLAGATRAQAQIALDQFKPAPLASDGFAVARPDVLKKRGFGALALLDYTNDPLVFKARNGTEYHVVEHQLVLHLGAAFALTDRITAFGLLPINVVMSGDDEGARLTNTPPADGPGLGDLTLGGRLLILGDATERIQISGELIARLPTSQVDSDQTYAGDAYGSYEPALIGELHFGIVDMRARGGIRFRKKETIGNLDIGNELLYGYGLRVRATEKLSLHGELYGSSNFQALKEFEVTPFEMLAGAKYQHNDWFFGGAAGPGLKWGDNGGFGSPDFRLIASLGYAPVEKEEPIKDSDGDGLLDPHDKCPNDPEDTDDFEDADGCSDPDNDQDGILDLSDECPLDVEDKDGFQDENGCPDGDNDKDGIKDEVDQCPNDPEDKDSFEDENGCPDKDNDKDGVLDVDDKCPLVPGVWEQGGCPAVQIVKVDVEKGQIFILERVEFETNKDTILEQSFNLLETVKKTLDENPQLKKVRVEGHTDNKGPPTKNLELSKRRALSVAKFLMERGTPAERLEAYGCGMKRPIDSNASDEGRQKNRRVEFHIVDPAPADKRSTKGCEQIEVK